MAPAAEGADIGFDAVDGEMSIVSVEWDSRLSMAEGFSPGAGSDRTTISRVNDDTQCTTMLFNGVPADVDAATDERSASDSLIVLALGQSAADDPGAGLGDATIDSRLRRVGGGEVAIRLASVAWANGENALVGARAFSDLGSGLILVVACPATASAHDEIRMLESAGYIDAVVETADER